ncbi:MAG TPA: hypothetical protein VMK42_15445 [Anaeromyxobacteraceae bacterium]|nr:hypothetical protein [Anaeromyxobacteraceae bacterium]
MADPAYPFDEPPPDVPGQPVGSGTVGFLADVVRKTVLTGMGALFLTEEGARKLAREWKLPKELAGFLVQQAHGAKDEVLRVVGQEIRRFFESETFRRELLKLLDGMTVEVRSEIRLKEGPAGRRRTRVRVKRTPAKAEEGPPDPAGPDAPEGAKPQ